MRVSRQKTSVRKTTAAPSPATPQHGVGAGHRCVMYTAMCTAIYNTLGTAPEPAAPPFPSTRERWCVGPYTVLFNTYSSLAVLEVYPTVGTKRCVQGPLIYLWGLVSGLRPAANRQQRSKTMQIVHTLAKIFQSTEFIHARSEKTSPYRIHIPVARSINEFKQHRVKISHAVREAP